MRITLTSHIEIKLGDIDPKVVRYVEKHLTFLNPQYEGAQKHGDPRTLQYIPKYIRGYEITNKKILITRGFLKPLLVFCRKNKIKVKVKDKRVTHKSPDKLKPINTRDYQVRASKKAKKAEEGVIKMPCGAGKTITCTDIIRRLQQYTIVIVHTQFIMDQWIEYFRDKYDYEPGVIQGENWDVKPITIAMVQTLAQRDLTKAFYKMWGCVVVDECHRVPANTFYGIVTKFWAKYKFGTTATSRRNDGLTNLIFATLGGVCFRITAKTLAKRGWLTIPRVIMVPTDFTSTGRYQTAIKELTQDRARNRLIINNLVANNSRYNLVLSSRIEHLERLVNLYKRHSDNYVLITSEMKAQERLDSVQRMLEGELHVIFATQLADEGLDIPNLDTVHLVFPTKADNLIEQRVGRIQRKKDVEPIVYDYNDIYVNRFYQFTMYRQYLYEQLELDITTNTGGNFLEKETRK